MLTNNWKSMIGKTLISSVNKMKSWAGLETNPTSSQFTYSKRFYIGTGNTPAKQSDYKMESLIDDAMYLSNLEVVCAHGDGSFESETGLYVSGTVTNMSSSPLEVSEIGFSASGTNANEERSRFLIAREVFDTPITISPGGGTGFQLKNLLISLFQRGGASYAY